MPTETMSNYAFFESKSKELVIASLEKSAISREEYIKQVLDFIYRPEEKERRFSYTVRRKILVDDWYDLLKTKLGDLLNDAIMKAVAGKFGQHVDTCMNPARDIWKELGSVLYSITPVRKYGDEKQNEKFRNIIEGTGFDKFWRDVDVASEAFNNVILMPTITYRNGKPIIKHRWYTGDNVVVIVSDGDPTEVESLILIDNGKTLEGKEYTNFILYNDKWHFVFNEKGEIVSKGDGESPLGIIPAVHLRLTGQPINYWDDTTGNDLVNQTLWVGIHRTLTNYLWKMSAHKQLIVYGDGVSNVLREGEQLSDPGAILTIDTGVGGNVQLVDWQPDFGSRRQWINDDISNAISSRGINPRRMQREAYQVGPAAKMYDRGLAERARNKMETFKTAEREYVYILGLLCNYYGIEDAYDVDQKLEVEYQRYEYPQDPIELLDYYEKAINLNVDRISGAIQKLHPEWSDEQVQTEYETNVLENTQLAEIRARRNAASKITTESLTAEQFGKMGPIIRDQNKEDGTSLGSSTETTTDEKTEEK